MKRKMKLIIETIKRVREKLREKKRKAMKRSEVKRKVIKNLKN